MMSPSVRTEPRVAAPCDGAPQGWEPRARVMPAGLHDDEAQQILDTMHDAFIAVDGDSIVIAWNRAAEAMFGYIRAEALGTEMGELILPPEMRARHRDAVVHMVATGEGTVLGTVAEQEAVNRSGETVPVEISHWWIRTGARPVIYAFLRDVSERRRHTTALLAHREREVELTRLALHDPLTGLPNRAMLVDRIRTALARHARDAGRDGAGRRETAVMFLDLDKFKVVNDSFGHDAGDALLVAVAARLGATVRAADTVARVAGDEFVIVCEDLPDRAEALALARRIHRAMSERFTIARQAAHVGVSIGIAFAGSAPTGDIATANDETGPGADPVDTAAEALLRDADAAMYRAKQLGPSSTVVFDDAMRASRTGRLQLERDLVRAAGRGELRLRYRPIAACADRSVIGMHMWVCWQHPQLGLLYPQQFLSIAEESGSVAPISSWAMQRAGQDLREWIDGGATGLSVLYSVAARHVTQDGYVERLAEVFRNNDLDPASTLMAIDARTLAALPDLDLFVGVLRDVAALGMRLGLSRFGIDVQVLRLIKELPLAAIMLPPELVVDVDSDPRGAVTARALIALGADLGLAVGAEGVTTEDQWDRLAELGCDWAQGDLLGVPLPLESVSLPSVRRCP